MDTYTVTRESDIAASPERVRASLVDFKQWRQWSPWESLDPDLKRTYGGSETGVGATYNWSGNRKAGQGRMEITKDTPEEVVIAVDFVKPFKSSTTTTFNLQPKDDATHVTWTMVGPKTFATKVMGIFTSMDKFIGKDFEKGLAQLNTYVKS
jgi:hypothetical protein